MTSPLPSLHALHCFDVAARAGSFSAAAREMHVTHGAISRQIRALETQLDSRLFVRRGRQVALTSEGQALMAVTERTFNSLREGLAEIRRKKGGPIVLSCEPTLTLEWLFPRLADFQSKHPELTVHVESSGGLPDFERNGVDIAVRREDFAIPPTVLREPLMDEWLGPVCSPEYGRHRARAKRVTLLHTHRRPAAFDDWMRAAGRMLKADRELTFDHFAWSIRAAIAGMGLAIGPYPLVKDALNQGRLVAPFGFVRGGVGYVLLAVRTATEDPRTHSLRQWLKRQARGMHP